MSLMRQVKTLVALFSVALMPSLARTQVAGAGGSTAATDAVARLRSMNMSDQELRRRLTEAGADTAYADSIQRLVSASDPAAFATPGILQVLAKIGATPTSGAAASIPGETRPERSNVFGHDIFAGGNSVFDPIAAGPLDPSYRLGMGDQLQLVFTGDVEAAIQLEVRRDGTVLIPQLGQISVVGLTLEAARGLIRLRAGRLYSGIPSGKTQVDLSVSRVRSIQVYVIGEVSAPGAYQVSALATLFHAVSRAGGPSARGSYRAIELRRAGTLYRRVDLYDYLLRGDESNDVRLEQGDVVFVPLAGKHVQLSGMVRRPGTFELLRTEQLGQLLDFGGGLRADAATDRMQAARMLPPNQRAPGKERVIVDLRFGPDSVAALTAPVYDGDSITVFSISNVRRNEVKIDGEVFRRGTYEYRDSLTLAGLVGLAGGLTPWSLPDRVKLTRLDRTNGRTSFLSLDLSDPASQRLKLVEYDEVEVLDARLLGPRDSVSIAGAITKDTVGLSFSANLKLQDLIDLGGGLRVDAGRIEIARRRVGQAFSDTTSDLIVVPVAPDGSITPQASSLLLARGDRIAVRASPGYRPTRIVSVSGQFGRPGDYILLRESESLSSVVQRAGGVLPTASASTFRLVRGGRVVPIDFARLLAGDPQQDIPVAAGDIVRIDRAPTTVFVLGAVQREVAVPYRANWRLRDYVTAAGGFTDDATRKVVVEDAGGAVSVTTLHRLSFTYGPRVTAGSTITAVARPAQSGTAFQDAVTLALQISSVLASLIIASVAIRR